MNICRLLNSRSPSPGRATTATAATATNDPIDDDYTGATVPQLPPPLFDTYDDLFAFLRNFHLSNGAA
ncbi:transposase [Metarhizium robertsii ARSEF 23]|nr:transposase [Metarhizium robertsii ARSEF 23]EFY94591.2 transposase [Metarhizium robertsii ARSEF 23]